MHSPVPVPCPCTGTSHAAVVCAAAASIFNGLETVSQFPYLFPCVAEMDPPVGGGEAGQARCRQQAGSDDDEDFQPDTKRVRGPGGTGSDSKKESRGGGKAGGQGKKKSGGGGKVGRQGEQESRGGGKDGGQGKKKSRGGGKAGGRGQGGGGGGGGDDVAVPLSQNTGDRYLSPHQTTVIFLAPQHDGAWVAFPDDMPGVAGVVEVRVTTASVIEQRPLFSAHASYPRHTELQTPQACGVQQEERQDGHYVLLGTGSGGRDERGDHSIFPKGFIGESQRGCAAVL